MSPGGKYSLSLGQSLIKSQGVTIIKLHLTLRFQLITCCCSIERFNSFMLSCSQQQIKRSGREGGGAGYQLAQLMLRGARERQKRAGRLKLRPSCVLRVQAGGRTGTWAICSWLVRDCISFLAPSSSCNINNCNVRAYMRGLWWGASVCTYI